MNRNPLYVTIAVGALGLTLACGGQPQLDVQQQEPATAAPAPAEPAAAEVVAAHATTPTTELPPGHPPTGGMPADHPPIAAQGAMQLAPVPAEAGQGATALAWTAPATWVAEPPANTMRRAQYRVPGPGGDAEMVVFYFGPGQGGDPQSNAERWASQFLGADGQPVRAETTTRAVNGVDVLFVEAAGTYQSGSMMGMGQGLAKPDWALLGAVAQGPDANWFFKFTGPKATVEANRAAFEAMIGSLERGS